MSVNSNEQINDDQQGGNPAWQDLLNDVPADLHGILTPKLQEWDRNVQQRLQDVHSQYEPYKQLVEDNVPAEFVYGALGLAQQFQQDPAVVVQQAIDTFGLDYVEKAAQQLQQQELNDGFGDDFDNPQDDITKHPAFQQISQQLEQLTTAQQEEQRKAQESQQATEFEKYMADLHEQHGNFNDTFVTALISQGIDGAKAVEQYNQIVAGNIVNNPQQQQAPNNNTAPIVMGNEGQSGSGIPEQPVRMGDLKSKAVNDLVLQMINQSSNDNNVSGG